MTGIENQESEILWKLAAHFVQASGVKPTDNVANTNRLFGLAARILSSTLSTGTVADESSTVQSLRHDLEQRGYTDKAVRLSELQVKLSRTKLSPKSRSSVLRLLQLVSRDSRRALASHSAISLTQSYFSGAHDGLAAIDFVKRPRSVQTQSGQALPYRVSLASTADGSLSLENSRANLSDSYSDPVLPKPTSRPTVAPAAWENITAYTVKEPVLVRDVLYVCQGLRGHYAHLEDADSDDAVCVVSPMAGADVVEVALVQRLAETGWLFTRVNRHASGWEEEQGCVRQALCAALHQELNEFYRLMAILEAQAGMPLPQPGDSQAPAPYLTLHRLSAWLGDPQRRLRLLADIADSTQHLSGGALAGAVQQHMQHGDPFIHGYVGKILQQVCVPLFEMIRRWVLNGELEDPHQEFFINSSVDLDSDSPGAASSDLWRSGYWIEFSQLPPFLSHTLANNILRAGKSIHFLQECCMDSKWVQERAAAVRGVASVNFDQVESLERFVTSVSSEVDRRLIEVLMSQFHFTKHCDALRRYLLLGQGDFVAALMDLMVVELDKPAKDISALTLNHLVRQAMMASNGKFDDEDVVDRLQAKKHQHTDNEPGWHVFSLNYAITGPLATIFTPAAMNKYLCVFQLLWKMKRVEHALACAWRLLKCEVERALPRFSPGLAAPIALVLRRCLQLRSLMSHFTTNLQYYIMLEVLEGSWQNFSRKVSSVSDLDALIDAHEVYLDAIISKALLGPGTEKMREVHGDLCSNMLGLAALVFSFHTQLQAALQANKTRQARAEKRAVQGQWGTYETEVGGEAGLPPHEVADMLTRLDDLEHTHHKLLGEFTEALPTQTLDDVRFLLYRLDFTEFYNRRRSLVGDDSDG